MSPFTLSLALSILLSIISLTALTSSQTIYTAYTSLNHSGCDTATEIDTCNLIVDSEIEPHYIFDCGHAGECIFSCTIEQGFRKGNVIATNTQNLIAEAVARHCFRNANVYVPDHGNATFNSKAREGLEDVHIYSGTNTQNIIINCANDAIYAQSCREMDSM